MKVKFRTASWEVKFRTASAVFWVGNPAQDVAGHPAPTINPTSLVRPLLPPTQPFPYAHPSPPCLHHAHTASVHPSSSAPWLWLALPALYQLQLWPSPSRSSPHPGPPPPSPGAAEAHERSIHPGSNQLQQTYNVVSVLKTVWGKGGGGEGSAVL